MHYGLQGNGDKGATRAHYHGKHVGVEHPHGEAEFVKVRRARDRQLAMPVLILPSVQVNIRAGAMPPPAADGNIYLKLPVNRL